jgi:hypothetical protein
VNRQPKVGITSLKTSTMSSTHPKRHSVHWDKFGDCFLLVNVVLPLSCLPLTLFYQVGSTVYKLDSKILKQHSLMFRDMFAMPPAHQLSHMEGATEDNPIVIPQIKESEFDLFLSQVYGKYIFVSPSRFFLPNCLCKIYAASHK